MLEAFWHAMDQAAQEWREGRRGGANRAVRWVTFNGKRFDAPYLQARSAARGTRPM